MCKLKENLLLEKSQKQQLKLVFVKISFFPVLISKIILQDTLTECMILLKEATEILNSEPDMKEFLQEKLQDLVQELDF